MIHTKPVFHIGKRVLSVFLAFCMVFSGFVFSLPVQAAASDSAYHWTIHVNTTNKADMDEVLVRIYYYPKNGTDRSNTSLYYNVTLADCTDASKPGEFKDIFENERQTNFEGDLSLGFPYKIEVVANFRGGFRRKLRTTFTMSVYAANQTTVLATASGNCNHTVTGGGVKTDSGSVPDSSYPRLSSVAFEQPVTTTIAVPTDGASDTYTYTAPGKDQYGVTWYQATSYSVNSSKVSINSSSGMLTVPPTANAANNYAVVITARNGSYSATQTVNIKTFDYLVTFRNYNGNTLSSQTVNYGQSATPPETPTRPYDSNYHYVFNGWSGTYQNLTSGAQNKSVTATYTAAAHTYTDTVETAATCSATGVMRHTCTCGYSYTTTIEKDANSHTGNTEVRNAKPASCTAAGYTGDTYCADCGVRLSTGQPIPANGHSWSGWIVVTPATCEGAGSEKHACSACGAEETRAIAALGHSYKHVTVPTT